MWKQTQKTKCPGILIAQRRLLNSLLMKRIILQSVLLTVVCVCSFGTDAAEAVKLEMDLTVDVDCIAPAVIVNYGQEAEIYQEVEDGIGYAIAVTPTKLPKASPEALQTVNLAMRIYKQENGSKRLISSPKITSMLGERALIETTSEEQTLSLSVLPSPQL